MLKSKNTKSSSAFINILKGLITGLLIFFLFLSVFSITIINTDISDRYLYLFILISSAFSEFSGSFITGLFQRKSRVIIATTTSIILLIFTFILLLCFNNASLSVRIYLLIPVALVFGFTGSLAGANSRKKN